MRNIILVGAGNTKIQAQDTVAGEFGKYYFVQVM